MQSALGYQDQNNTTMTNHHLSGSYEWLSTNADNVRRLLKLVFEPNPSRHVLKCVSSSLIS